MSENIETPEDWERRGPCLTREYGGKLAVLDFDPDTNLWYATIHGIPNDISSRRWLPLPEAVAWANEQLGVPKPVEVVEEKFADGSYVLKDKENTRWAVVYVSSDVWWVHRGAQSSAPYSFVDDALRCARAYVRGAA